MTIEIYVLLIFIFTMFALGVIACIGWNKEVTKLAEQKRVNIQLQHEVRMLKYELAKVNVTEDILTINKEVEKRG